MGPRDYFADRGRALVSAGLDDDDDDVWVTPDYELTQQVWSDWD